jgi:biotin carboxyl carrier protein
MSRTAKSQKKKSVPEPPMEQLEIGSIIYQTRLTSKFRNRVTWQRPDVRKVLAIIPGNIQRIMVKEGDEVAQGTPMLILEAMKMRNEILSPFQGIIKKINVSEGEMVPKAHLLLEFE